MYKYLEFRSKEQIEMESSFADKVSKIELAHKDFFDNNKPTLPIGEPDSLRSHFDYSLINGFAKIAWSEKSNLSQDIKDEVESAFRETFVQ